MQLSLLHPICQSDNPIKYNSLSRLYRHQIGAVVNILDDSKALQPFINCTATYNNSSSYLHPISISIFPHISCTFRPRN